MVGNKQGEWENEIEKHSKQREQHVQRNESVKAAVYLKKLGK